VTSFVTVGRGIGGSNVGLTTLMILVGWGRRAGGYDKVHNNGGGGGGDEKCG
jgi:hypothetical protein